MVMLKSKDSLDKIKQFYETTLKEQGWENESSMNMGQNAVLANKKENRTLNVSIISGDETIIQLMIAEEK